MNMIELGFLALVFCAVLGGALAAMRLGTGGVVQGRIDALADKGAAGTRKAAPLIERIARLTTPLARLSLPDDQWERSAIRTRFMMAGLRHPAAPAVFFAAKTLLALLLPLLLFGALTASGRQHDPSLLLAGLLLAATLGTYLPNVLLRSAIGRRQRAIFESFPDALDLMTICVEAGLGIDAALTRVANEISLSSQVLGEELTLVTLELRAGGSKEKALRNLALRTGVEDVDALVSMLIQAERFGTSIGASLRIQSDLLRTKRRMRAEESAAKIGLKLLFPLIFFIFPALLVILMGPAMIQIYRVMLPAMASQ